MRVLRRQRPEQSLSQRRLRRRFFGRLRRPGLVLRRLARLRRLDGDLVAPVALGRAMHLIRLRSAWPDTRHRSLNSGTVAPFRYSSRMMSHIALDSR